MSSSSVLARQALGNMTNRGGGRLKGSKNKPKKFIKSDFRQCFKLYATEGSVTSPEKLGFIMRSLNIKPTITELSGYFQKYKKDDGLIDFADFLNILHTHLQLEDSSKEVLNAFKVYDSKKTGYVTIKELKSILTMTGEKLSSRDVDMILQEVKPTKDGKIKYEDLIKVMCTPIADY